MPFYEKEPLDYDPERISQLNKICDESVHLFGLNLDRTLIPKVAAVLLTTGGISLISEPTQIGITLFVQGQHISSETMQLMAAGSTLITVGIGTFMEIQTLTLKNYAPNPFTTLYYSTTHQPLLSSLGGFLTGTSINFATNPADLFGYVYRDSFYANLAARSLVGFTMFSILNTLINNGKIDNVANFLRKKFISVEKILEKIGIGRFDRTLFPSEKISTPDTPLPVLTDLEITKLMALTGQQF
jgi:hypothetical protein